MSGFASKLANDAMRRERILACAVAALLLAVLLISHAASGVFAKYSTAASASDAARVALFGHNESVDLSNWVASLKPGDSREIALQVSNANSGGEISEVAQEYDIEVETAGNLPLAYTLMRDGAVIGSFGEKSSAVHTFASDGMAFAPGNSETHAYALVVNWPAEENSVKYADVPDYVQVRINVRQVD